MTVSRTGEPRLFQAEDDGNGGRVTFGEVGEQPCRPGWTGYPMLLDGVQIAWIEEGHAGKSGYAWYAYPLGRQWEILLEVSDCETPTEAMAEARALVEERL